MIHRNTRKTLQEFIEDAKLKHGTKYDYSLSQYINAHQKLIIICKKHGQFLQSPNHHLTGWGCKLCGLEQAKRKNTKSNEDYITECKKTHNNLYDYSITQYIKDREKIKYICHLHGIVIQGAAEHRTGKGCKKCGDIKRHKKKTSNTQDFIKKAKKIHGENYDYRLVNYIKAKTDVTIICKNHGQFIQKPNYHLNGNGCPKCRASWGEKLIKKWLDNNNIEYRYDAKIGCINPKTNCELIFDFFLSNHAIAIEYDGIQHFKEIKFHSNATKEETKKKLEEGIKRDNFKTKWCKDNNIKLIRIPYFKKSEINQILQENIRPK